VQGGYAVRVLTAEPPARLPAETGILLTVALGTMLVPLNSTMIAVALPRLIADFDARLTSAGWLVTGYLIAMASLQPVAGNLGDRLGRRPLVLGGLVWFAIASLGAGLASSLPLLIGFRIQQGIAGALVFPNGIALLREIAPPGRLGSRLGLVMSALPLAAALGPLLAGGLLAFSGWRSIFLVNLRCSSFRWCSAGAPSREAAGGARPAVSIWSEGCCSRCSWSRPPGRSIAGSQRATGSRRSRSPAWPPRCSECRSSATRGPS